MPIVNGGFRDRELKKRIEALERKVEHLTGDVDLVAQRTGADADLASAREARAVASAGRADATRQALSDASRGRRLR